MIKLYLRRRIGARYGTIPLHTGRDLEQLRTMAREQLQIETPEEAVQFLLRIACVGNRAAPIAGQNVAKKIRQDLAGIVVHLQELDSLVHQLDEQLQVYEEAP